MCDDALLLLYPFREATARHDAERREQVAKGQLERQMIDDKAKVCFKGLQNGPLAKICHVCLDFIMDLRLWHFLCNFGVVTITTGVLAG